MLFSSVLLAIGLLSVLLCVLLEVYKWRMDKVMGPHMGRPSDGDVPVLGVGHRFIGKDNEAVLALIAQLFAGEITPARAWFGPMLVVGVAHPEDMQTVLSSPDCLQKGYMYKFIHNESGLFTADVETWKVHRRVLNPTFSLKAVQQFVPVFNEKAQRMVEIMADDLPAAGEAPVPVNVYHATFMCTLDITVNTLMSTSMELQNPDGEFIYDAFSKAFESVARRMYRFWQYPDFVYERTQAYREEIAQFHKGHDFVQMICDRKSFELAERMAAGDDVLERERQAGTLTYLHKCFLAWREGVFSEQNVHDEVLTILIGGIDTSAITLTHTMLMLAMHPDVQSRVVVEMLEIFGADAWWSSSEGEQQQKPLQVTQEDCNQMVYLHQVIHESLRLLPAGPYLSRMCRKDLKLRNSTIPANSVVLLLFDKMNRDRSIWGPTANDFNPDRFLPEHCASRHPWSFLPFSGGPRNCIGIRHASVSVRLMIAQLLHRFRFSSKLKLADIRIKMDITTKILNDDPFWAERRTRGMI